MSRPVKSTAAPETTIAGYRVHPAAMLLPEPSPEEYERMKADIQEHGLREQIVLTLDDHTDDDLILDGRTRAKILKELGIEIRTESLVEKGVWKADPMVRYLKAGEDDDPIAYVLSANAARRHLTGDQIIALYLEANKAKLEADKLAAKAAQQAGLKKGSTKPVGATVSPTGKTAAKIAKAVGKSESAVKRVLKVQKVAPEKMADVVAGKTSASKVLKKVTYSRTSIVEETAKNEEKQRLEQQRLEFKQKRAAERAKMLLIIGAGYKQIAPQCHPDTGGTNEAMIVLGRARDLLTRYAEKWS